MRCTTLLTLMIALQILPRVMRHNNVLAVVSKRSRGPEAYDVHMGHTCPKHYSCNATPSGTKYVMQQLNDSTCS